MSIRVVVAAAGIASGMFGAAGISLRAQTQQLISSCVKASGQVRIVSATEACNAGEQRLEWPATAPSLGPLRVVDANGTFIGRYGDGTTIMSVGTEWINQARRNVIGAQQGPPAPPEVIANIVAFEESLSTAQLIVFGVGRLDDDGAAGDPEALSQMTKTAGRFDLYDAWAGNPNPRRAQIARGQEVFNTAGCGGCHDSANNGTNTSNLLFDIGTASAAVRTPDLPLYTFENRTTLRDAPADRRRAGQHHRRVERPREVQDADAARPRGARAVLPQWHRAHDRERRALLRGAARLCFHRCATRRSGGVPDGVVVGSGRRRRLRCAGAVALLDCASSYHGAHRSAAGARAGGHVRP